MPSHKNLVSLAKAAEYADCSVWTIRRRVSDGSLPAFRVGPRLIKVDLEDVDNLLRRIPTTGGAA